MKNIEDYTVTKSTVECYKIRHPSGMYWADITIDASDRSGRIQIASDFGDYQRYWGACGKSFKEFLCSLDMHYAAGKFGANDWFDHDKTIRGYKLSVIEYRRNESISKEEARKIYDEINDVDTKGGCTTSNELVNYISGKDALMEFFDYMPEVTRDITPQFRKFWATAWVVFINELKREAKEADKIVTQL
jgi:hypothetical protein